MPDRLSELRRERALVQERLAQLERELAASAAGGNPPPEQKQPPTVPEPAADPIPATSAAPDPDAMFGQYQPDPGALRNDVRKGCFLYFAGALVLLALGTVALAFLLRSR